MVVLVKKNKRGGSRLGELQKEIARLPEAELRQIHHHVSTALDAIKKKTPTHVPATIFSTKLSPAEAVVKYLKENNGLAFYEIAQLINRDQRGIWGSYSRAKRKHPDAFDIGFSTHTIPLSCFNDRSKSILEHVVTHLKDKKELKPAQICALLNKKTSTIWTAYQRGRKKNA